MNITALLIDDERKALATLRSKIERKCPNVSIIGETQIPQEALEMIEELNPQLVFLDIAMPSMSGFELLSSIPNPDFEIIFVTAFDDYAIKAISHCAIGYLVKPVNKQSLIKAVDNATKNIEEKTALKKNKLLVENLEVKLFSQKKIVIPSSLGLEFVMINDIYYCEGVDGYTKVHFNKEKPILSSNSIGHFKKLLLVQDFYLIHKSYLVNMNYIKKYLHEGYVILSNDVSIPIARNKRSDFVNFFKQEK